MNYLGPRNTGNVALVGVALSCLAIVLLLAVLSFFYLGEAAQAVLNHFKGR